MADITHPSFPMSAPRAAGILLPESAVAAPAPARSAQPANPWTAAYEYAVDALQRSVLYADVMRQRGNQYHSHMAKRAPNVLSMKSELVLDGREFARPVNYGLLRILPPPGVGRS